MTNKKSAKIYFENGIAMLDGKPYTGKGRGRIGFPLAELEEAKDRLEPLDIEFKFGENDKTKKIKISSFLEEKEVEFNYVDGKRHGTYLVFYKNGDLESESNYYEGLQDGVQKTWDKNGDLKRESNYVKGKKHGIDKIYSKGIINSEFEWRNDELTISKVFDDDGLLSMKEKYMNNEIVSSKIYWYENGVRFES